VELLPVHHNVPEEFLIRRGLTNYWGYNTIRLLAPRTPATPRQRAPGDRAARSRNSVPWSTPCTPRGWKVVLDVVFNHTAEGGPGGPTLCFRGLDNAGYYRLDPDDPGNYVDTTGCR